MSTEWFEKDGKKYRIDGELYIAEDESHIFYRGVKFNWFGGYYRRHHFSKVIPCNLQRAVWIDHFGPIPEKHHIHHIDGNTRNNHIENFQCLPAALHLSRAAKKSKWIGSKEQIEHLAAIREKTKIWHASKEGHEWHKKHVAKNKRFAKISFKSKCNQCGKKYEAHAYHQKFCSGSCKSRSRRISGVDSENRKCSICSKYFVINRYSKTETCSRSCANQHSRKHS